MSSVLFLIRLLELYIFYLLLLEFICRIKTIILKEYESKLGYDFKWRYLI